MDYITSAKLLNIPLECCRECGSPIVWCNSKVRINRRGDVVFEGKTQSSTKVVNGNPYHLQVCEHCFVKKFGKATNFGITDEKTKWAFGITDEDYLQDRKKYALTLDKMIQKYGEEEGKSRWNIYCDKQAETNTFEYKNKKYGWSREQFNEYNKSRAVTLKNLIARHGEEEGKLMWADYCQRQVETKSWEYLVDKYGTEGALKVNRSKAINLENMIRVHGEVEGKKAYAKWLSQFERREPQRWSGTSQAIFNTFKPFIEAAGWTCKYQTNGGEQSVITSTGGYLLDFYIPEIKVAIEYNGGVFHADPRLYKDDEYCNPLQPHKTAKEIREYDKIRINSIYKELGIKTYIIWELDYKQGLNLEEYIKQIIKTHATH